MSENERSSNNKARQPLNARTRQRGLYGQITTVLLRPALFFRTLLPAGETRQWLWAALIVLAAIGIATVRYAALAGDASGDSGIVAPMPIDPGFGGDGGIPPSGPDFGGIPPGGIPDPGAQPTGAETTVTEDLTTALLAASSIMLGWLILTLMLIVVPMLRGRAPRLGMNLQIAVWSSLPLAVMAVIQLIYYAAGGNPGAPGIEGVVTGLPEFATWEPTVQALAISLASRFTIFWLWSLLLVYFGIRFSLNGWRIVAFVIVLLWAVIQVGAPVLTGAIAAPEPEMIDAPIDMPGGEMMPGDMEPGMPGDLGMPSDMGDGPVDAPAGDGASDMPTEGTPADVPPAGDEAAAEETPQP